MDDDDDDGDEDEDEDEGRRETDGDDDEAMEDAAAFAPPFFEPPLPLFVGIVAGHAYS